jgi:lysophospholipase L1-like esterase
MVNSEATNFYFWSQTIAMQRHYTLLALGDSYTIGEAIPLHQSFPYQAVQLLRKKGYNFSAPEIIAKTGWTTEELQAAMEDHLFSSRYDFVTLLIGVNNQYRGQQIIHYKEQFETLLNKSLELTGDKKDHLFVLSIPDYSHTPFAAGKNKGAISKEIDEYNKLNKAICIQYRVPYIDTNNVFGIAGNKEVLIAEDGLHPSAAAYAGWAKKLAEAIEKLVKK